MESSIKMFEVDNKSKLIKTIWSRWICQGKKSR